MPTLFKAVIGGKPDEVVKVLQQKPSEIDAKNRRGQTALMIAAELGDTSILQILLEAHADTTIGDNKLWTALTYAARHGHVGCLKLLLEKEQFS